MNREEFLRLIEEDEQTRGGVNHPIDMPSFGGLRPPKQEFHHLSQGASVLPEQPGILARSSAKAAARRQEVRDQYGRSGLGGVYMNAAADLVDDLQSGVMNYLPSTRVFSGLKQVWQGPNAMDAVQGYQPAEPTANFRDGVTAPRPRMAQPVVAEGDEGADNYFDKRYDLSADDERRLRRSLPERGGGASREDDFMRWHAFRDDDPVVAQEAGTSYRRLPAEQVSKASFGPMDRKPGAVTFSDGSKRYPSLKRPDPLGGIPRDLSNRDLRSLAERSALTRATLTGDPKYLPELPDALEPSEPLRRSEQELSYLYGRQEELDVARASLSAVESAGLADELREVRGGTPISEASPSLQQALAPFLRYGKIGMDGEDGVVGFNDRAYALEMVMSGGGAMSGYDDREAEAELRAYEQELVDAEESPEKIKRALEIARANM